MDDGLTGGLSGGAAAVVASADLASLAGGGGAHGGQGHGASTTCLNCGTALAPGARFCSQCGQDTANHPPSLFEFVHEFVSHYIAVEGTLWKTLWGLMAKPGFLTLEYLAGRKQRYVLPLRLILTLGLLFFLALKFAPGQLAHVNDELAAAMQEADGKEGDDPGAAVAGSPASAAAAAKAIAAAKVAQAASAVQAAGKGIEINIGHSDTVRTRDANSVVSMDADTLSQLPPGMRARVEKANERWRTDPKGALRAIGSTMLSLAPYAVLCSLPFFAGLLKLLFWRQTYGAHFVFAMHLHAAWYGMLLIGVLLPWAGVGFAMWLWSSLYPVIALKRVHAASWLTTGLRAALLALLHWVVLAFALAGLALAGVLAAA
jgi:hypothetical protein